jgi:hypothetical protein
MHRIYKLLWMPVLVRIVQVLGRRPSSLHLYTTHHHQMSPRYNPYLYLNLLQAFFHHLYHALLLPQVPHFDLQVLAPLPLLFFLKTRLPSNSSAKLSTHLWQTCSNVNPPSANSSNVILLVPILLPSLLLF